MKRIFSLFTVTLIVVAVFAACAAFAADPAAAPGVSVVDVLTGFGIPASIVHWVVVALVVCYVLVTEVLPFIGSIKANGVFHFFYLACKAMRVDPNTEKVEFSLDQLRQVLNENQPALPATAPAPEEEAAPASKDAPLVPAAPDAPTAEQVAQAQAVIAAAQSAAGN